eukprot:CAMPEP_0184695184 /NCGR_PEP_ID=MMETSP0313-20130426/2904_1 /TAXON_ID=2792 /ORGANISM="Porphyridium aerugineum, Strain SAG 1380-2" /LENGTH=137 /DNA_ID=CAMNT_0027153597 /DNA_START=80 /DNA_END=493 /DNA_ORIENTATION=-
MDLSRRRAPMDLWWDTPRFESLFRSMQLEASSFGAMNSYVTKEGSAVIHIDLPGVKKDDVQIIHENGTVNIKAKRQTKFTSEEVDEESFSEIQRSFTVPERAFDVSKATASMNDGVLKICVPRLPESEMQQQSISIQ